MDDTGWALIGKHHWSWHIAFAHANYLGARETTAPLSFVVLKPLRN